MRQEVISFSGGPPSLAISKWLDIFQYCRFLRLLGNIMVILVIGLVGFIYSAVLLTYGRRVLHSGGNPLVVLGCVLVLLLFTGIAGMTLWSYLAAVTVDPGRVPAGWHPFTDELQARAELERMSYSNYYPDRRDPRRPRYCKRCQAWKPERAHHCSVTGRCVLKMDHWCIWVVNCVGLLNYKFFLLFIAWAGVGCLLAFLLLLPSLLAFFRNDLRGPMAPVIFIADILSFAFSLSLGGFAAMHGQLLAANCTTIEMYEKDRLHPWPYNKGFRRNFEEVFGRNKLRWFLPLYTKAERQGLLDSVLASGSTPSSHGSSGLGLGLGLGGPGVGPGSGGGSAGGRVLLGMGLGLGPHGGHGGMGGGGGGGGTGSVLIPLMGSHGGSPFLSSGPA
ncbi:hypothetical protein HYH03_013578 [Edaphochlamys debaryana]|uniref:S-acyltransferase n=1 Tax=Edaphochlamys debaryana TaxID=47281 RepID=A0A835XN02_9CHLO|nr:hypothetical protein HYH03_013578 [Edaphochlamys debaryana]|eukprot:KAG2487862.1 hypothetical protein HYH03_013578 [Edaphochlamys debaryana]